MVSELKKQDSVKQELFSFPDTIVAQATPSGRGGIAVVRVSGKDAHQFAEHILRKKLKPRSIEYLPFLDERDQWIDKGVVLFFQAPQSLTGEDIVEFQGHGGPVVIERLLKRLTTLGARLARPGEFLERAFLNNKIDLLQVEAIHDLIQANNETAARCAARSLQGVFSDKINNLVHKLIQLRMYVEAAIDFPEEELELLSEGKVTTALNDLQLKLNQVVTAAKQGALLKKGIKVVIAGKPNAGKSSLLNKLSGYNSAIVTNIPGTTRDVLREEITLEGLILQISDTAGIRESDDEVENEGINRAKQEILDADHVLWLIDANEMDKLNIENDLTQYLFPLNALDLSKITIVLNKIDEQKAPAKILEKFLLNNIIDQSLANNHLCSQKITTIYLSVKTGEGIDLLINHLKKTLSQEVNEESIFLSRQRHVDALYQASQSLQTAIAHFKNHKAYELMAEELRLCQLALDEITGKFTSDDLLGKIFSEFCIGK